MHLEDISGFLFSSLKNFKPGEIYNIADDQPLSNEEIVSLYTHPQIKCIVSPTRGEGYGLPLIEAAASIVFRLIGLSAKWDAMVPDLSAGELETLIETGGVTGLKPDEQNILEGVFALRDTQVREVMVPRSGMVTLPTEVSFAELMKAVHRTRHARSFWRRFFIYNG